MSKRLHKIWTRDYDAYMCYGASRGLYNEKKRLRVATKEVFIFPNQHNKELYLTEGDYQSVWKELGKFYVDTIDKFVPHMKEALKAGESFIKECQRLSKDVSHLSNKELTKRYEEFIKIYCSYFVYLWSTFILDEVISKRVSSTIKSLKISEREKQELITYATHPTKMASVLLLNKEAKSKTTAQLTKEFSWITTLNIYDNPASQHDIRNRLSTNETHPIVKPKAVSTLPKPIQQLIEASKENAYVKDRRDDLRRQATFRILPLYDEIGKRLNVSRRELSFLIPEEIKKGLLGKKESLKNKARHRKEFGFFMHWHDGKFDFEDSASKIEEIKKKYGLSTTKTDEVKEIKGLIGYKGKVVGKVKVIATAKELHKIKVGNIMCCITTNPDYILGMEKAAAFITDEGGITCHAAIVAREMKKPCIIGTKIATKVLKDDDVIEVDADKGIIRRVKL